MDFEKVKPRRVYEDVLNQITKLMVEGKLNPGDKLMGEREMASALGVSRTTVREALRILEILGLVTIRVGDGTFIKDHNISGIIAPLALALSAEPNSYEELWATRVTLEVECAGLAALYANGENLQYIAQAIDEMQCNRYTNLKAYTKADMRFHYLIAQASENSIMARLLQTFAIHIHEMIQKARQGGGHYDQKGIKAINDHQKIYEAIRSQDVDMARSLMKEHLQWAMLEYKITLGK